MPSARLPSQPKTLATLAECSEENSLKNGRRSPDSKQDSVFNLKDESQEEMSTDLSSRSTVSKGQCGAQSNLHHLHQNHHHHHHHHQLKNLSHRAGSSSAKLVTHIHSKSTEPLYKMKQHQPHCQHYSISQHQKKQYHHEPHHHLQHHRSRHLHQHHQHHHYQREIDRLKHHSRLHRTSSDLSDDIVAKSLRCKPSRLISKQKDAPYLLVEPLPIATGGGALQGEFRFHQASNVNGYNNNNGSVGQPRYPRETVVCKENLKRATVKFISQLYFLLHLSAILSLLLHHKSLTAAVAERKPTDVDSQPTATSHSPGLVSAKKFAAFVNSSYGSGSAPVNLNQNTLLLPQSLPQPMSQLSQSTTSSTLDSNRLSRQVNSDFLVRLLGLWQARLVLHNFLSYLLLTSITILVSMRLCRLCFEPTGVKKLVNYHNSRSLLSPSCSSTNQLTDHQHPVPQNFFQQTRLDCTPVLVGSISLGVIQLITIGLDFANNLNTDWFAKAGWPTAYLPFFQFVFVALLMQYILGKVAKNHGQGKPSSLLNDNNNNNSSSSRILGQPTISFDKRSNWTSVSHSTSGYERSPVRYGFKNIALAHLLVTHILLWLLRLNSISLFRSFGDETSTTLSQTNHLTSLASNKHAKHYNLSSVDTSIVSDASFNFEPGSHKATQTNLQSIRAQSLPPLLNMSGSLSGTDQIFVDSPKAPKLPHQQPTSNKRSRDVFSMYNKMQQPPILDSVGLQHFRLVPVDPTSGLNLDTALSKSQQQLMELINIASKSRTSIPADFNSTASLAMLNSFPVQPTSPPANVVTYIKTTTLAPPTYSPKPQTMPKRPTVFRQNPIPLVVSSLSSQTPVHRFTIVPRHQTPTRSPSIEAKSEQKPRARVLLSRVENPVLDSNYKRINRPQLKKLSPFERPFPSVESDIPASITSTSTRAPFVSTASMHLEPTIITTTTSQPATTVVEVERDEVGNNSTVEEEPEEEGEEEGGDVVEGTPVSVQKSNNTMVSNIHNMRGPIGPATDARLVADEEALLANFGESTRLDTFTAPLALTSALDSTNEGNVIANSLQKSSTFERRFMEQETQLDSNIDRLSFADYLLPIVQQYHILIIAILFNMWLEGLRATKHQNHQKLEDCNKQTSAGIMRLSDRRFLLGQRNLLSSGSDRSRDRTDFLAIPVARSSLRRGLDKVSRLDFGSSALATPFQGSTSRWQAYAIQKHLSKSMDSLRHHRELAENESSSTLSRHNSLRSSSSEQLLSTSGRNKIPHTSSRSALLNLTSQQLLQQPQVSTLPLLASDKGLELSACSLFFGLITVCITLMVLVANQNYLSALAQCTILLASVLLCMVGLCLSNIPLPGDLREYSLEPKHVQSLHLIFILAGYFSAMTLLLNLDKRHTPGQPLPVVLLQFIHRHLMPISNQANQLFMFQLLLALKGFLLVLQVTLQTILIRASINRPISHLRRVYTSLMFANLGLWALELRDEQQFLVQHQHHHNHYSDSDRNAASSFSIPSLRLMNELSSTLVSLSHFYHALVFLQR